jgi:hypothetical protein
MKNIQRRHFLSLATFIPFLNFKKMDNQSSKQVIHHVFFWLKNPNSEADKIKLKEGLKTLEAIKEVKKLYIGEPASTLKRDVVVKDYQVTEMMFFNNTQDQDIYQVHPIHKAFVENYSHLWDKVVVYDMLVD